MFRKNELVVTKTSKSVNKMVYVPTSTTEFNDIVKSGVVIVDFSASWCKLKILNFAIRDFWRITSFFYIILKAVHAK